MTPAAVASTASPSSLDADTATNKASTTATRYDVDPSDPTRKVPHKKANSPFLVHQRWKQQQEQQKQQHDKMVGKIVELPADAEESVTTTATDAAQRAQARRRAEALSAKTNGTKKAGAGSSSASSQKQQQQQQKRGVGFFIFKWSLVTLFLALGAGQFIAGDVFWNYRGKYLKKQTYFPPTERRISVEELWEHNGEDPDKPIYLSILGHVYDVTPGRWIYGPKSSYSFFAGRDASRAYVTGCFQTHLTHDLRGLTRDELMSIQEWKNFFDDHARYRWIGRADLPPIDRSTPIPPSCHDNVEQKTPDEVQ